MKKKIFIVLTLVTLFFVPVFVSAESKQQSYDENNYEVIKKTTKYYKTVTYYDNVVTNEDGIIVRANKLNSVTTELTKEEYDNADISKPLETRGSTTIETTYKEMLTSLTYSNGTYRYENQLGWKLFPSVRSYDIIGIGHYGNVAPTGSPYFAMSYTTLSGSSYVSTWHMSQTFTYGSSATFLLPLENLSSLNITYYFDVHKTNPNSTITSQAAFGDYSHGIDSSLTLSQALDHYVNQNAGIVLSSSVYNKFDTINEAAVYWYGTW